MTSYERALEDYNRAIQLKQVDAYYANRAITLMSLKRPEEALTDMTKATEIAPTEPINYKNRAIIYDKLKLYAEA
jgi:tetratricopeptide (TPR) repeat protein